MNITTSIGVTPKEIEQLAEILRQVRRVLDHQAIWGTSDWWADDEIDEKLEPLRNAVKDWEMNINRVVEG